MTKFKKKAYDMMITFIAGLIVLFFIVLAILAIGFTSLGAMKVIQEIFNMLGM